MASERKLTRGLRFRLTLGYALFFTLMLAGVGLVFYAELSRRLDEGTREILTQEWAALKGYLRIEKGKPDWVFDREDPDEVLIVSRLQHIYMLADSQGKVIENSENYLELGLEQPDAVKRALRDPNAPVWMTRRSPDIGQAMIRGGVVFANDRIRDPYFVAIGRPLNQNARVLQDFTTIYLTLAPMLILGGCALGWALSGRALRPVMEVARAAQRISGSNLSLRIPTRRAGDELDYLITTFNRMIERLESTFDQIRRFSTDVSHELRTPLTAVRGQLEVALFNANDTEQYREAILNSLQDIERMGQIVRALLLLSQAETGQVALQKTCLDLTETLRDVFEQFEIPAEGAQVRLVAELTEGCYVNADRVQIERMASNLVSNALKFTPPGGEVRVVLRQDTDKVEFSVVDTGCGIAAEHLPHIFDRFYRVPTAEGSPERGLGLGLSFVSWIAKAHGGEVTVISQPGTGSRFTVTLPAAFQPAAGLSPMAMNEV